jgi:fatty acid desaturase
MEPERDTESENPLPRDEVYDTVEEELPERRHSFLWYVVGVIALFMVFLGLLWLAELIGLLAVFIPGGLSLFRATYWAVIGLVGLVLILLFLGSILND